MIHSSVMRCLKSPLARPSAVGAQSCHFTVLELLTVLAIIVALISLLLPGLNEARYRGKDVVCVSNLRQLGTGATAYAADYDFYFPQ